MQVSRCQQLGCTGHLGKYDSCRDEALHALSLDAHDWVGESDYGLTVTPVVLTEPVTVTLYGGQPTVTVPAGAYLVEEDDRGFVMVQERVSAEDLAQVVEAHRQLYAAWLGDDV